MSYSVRIAPEARTQIDSCGLSRGLLLGEFGRLNDLAGDPDGLLGEQIVPLSLRAYSFVLAEDRGPIPRRLHFTFAIDRDDVASELRVVGGRMDEEDPSSN